MLYFYFQYSYEVGQDLFGIKYTIDGQWTRPKSPYVEQFPMCGKRTMYVKFDPVQSTELDIHFQHIRGTWLFILFYISTQNNVY